LTAGSTEQAEQAEEPDLAARLLAKRRKPD
jgi:hypothetical protein